MKTSKNNIKSLVLALILSVAAISDASARACFLPDSGCGEGGFIGADKVEVPCQYFTCPSNLSVYQKCDDGRTYNNGGVNVTCKEITCKLSKKDCEDTAAKPNNTQCCNYDSESGCYYLGECPTLCNRAIYDSKTDLSGDEYTCTSCKDKTGTYYYCKSKGKECSEIVASSSTSCRDDQTSQPAYKDGVLVKDLNDKQCYICSDAPVGKECSAIVASSSNNPSCSANQTRKEAYKDGVLARDLNGKQCYICVDNQYTCDRIKGEYTSKSDCETNHPDTICNQNSSTQCWIGKCDTQGNTYYYETEDACYDTYQDQCYECNSQPCEQVDEDSNCWFINCNKIGMYNSKSDCEASASSGKCDFESGFGCYKPTEAECDEKQGLFATEYACEHFGLNGPANCTKEGNCYRPDMFRISADWRDDHCGRVDDDVECIQYGKLIFKATNNTQRQYTLQNSAGEIEIPAGSYTMKTTEFFGRRDELVPYCKGFYINRLEMRGSDDSAAYFDPQNYGNEQDLEQNNYTMTGTLREGLLGTTNGKCKVLINYYEYNTQSYEFKGGVTYSIGVIDTSVNCSHPGYNGDCVK